MFPSQPPPSPLSFLPLSRLHLQSASFGLIYTPTRRLSHFLFTLILLSVFIYLFYPVLSLPDFINTPLLLSFLSSFILGFSLLEIPLPHLLSYPIDG